MEFGILGPLEVRSAGKPIELGPYKQRALLALLLLHVDRVVPTDVILDELWGEESGGKEKALWVHISRLRSALEPQRTARGQSLLVTRDHGYSIRTDPVTLDAFRFEAAVGEARQQLIADPDGAAETLRDALALWRGTALQDFTYEGFAQTEITRLEELRLDAVETRINADLRRGCTSELVAELEALTHGHPLRERPVSQLMHALYRAGRQAEALRAFQRYRTRIVDELGLEPSPELRRLEEQILLHDTRLAPSTARAQPATATNPFKGLQAFGEADAAEFFGRDRLVADVVTRLAGGNRLVALVGPSGSGKSSVARAGVVPALRKGALPGSQDWLVASMVPGAYPFAELEAALLRSTLDAPESLSTQLADPTLGLLRATLRLLPDETARLVLVIDQFEELFTLTGDDSERQRFLANLVEAIDDPQGRVVVVLTLRADAYHRPLAYGDFAARLGPGVVNVLPLTTDELEEAAVEPAAQHGVVVEPALLAALLTDVIGEPGALPVFQFALTELFDRRAGDQLTLAAYRSIGGVRGVLTQRADDLYHGLSLEEQAAARQLFLRLVTITPQEQWVRRRVPASEILALGVDVVTMESVINQFGRQRFLAFDRDHSSGAPTVEVAHEALLSEWDRLRGWIEDGRDDVTRRAALDAAVAEWGQAGRDVDYLLGGNRLAEYERWRQSTSLRLTTIEHEYLDASLARRDQDEAAESARAAREQGLARRARRRSWALVSVVVVIAVALAGAVFVVAGRDEPPTVALVTMGDGSDIEALMIDGLERAARDFDVEPVVLRAPFSDLGDELSDLAGSGADLVVSTDLSLAAGVASIAPEHPETTWAYVDLPGVEGTSVTFAENEGAFLAGAAAALTSQTGTVGFVGGFQLAVTERFRAGFEAGARAVDPAIEILSAYTSVDGSGFARPELARQAATELYEAGADVILHAAGGGGAGVFAAARERSAAQGRHLWAIGADGDQYLDVAEPERPHVLTSTIKRFDVAVYELIDDFLDGGLEPVGRVLTLADGAVGYSTTGGHLPPDTLAALGRLEEEVIAGTRVVPQSPSGPLQPPLQSAVCPPRWGCATASATTTATVTYDGVTCRYDGPTAFDAGDIVRVEVVNTSGRDVSFSIGELGGYLAEITAPPAGRNEGYLLLYPGDQPTWCYHHPADTPAVPGPTIEVVEVGDGATAATTPMSRGIAAAADVAEQFLDAYGAFDSERALALLTDDALAAWPLTRDEFRLELAVLEALGYRQDVGGCAPQGEADNAVSFQCPFDLHAIGSDERGLGPFTGNYWRLTVRDGRIVDGGPVVAFVTSGFGDQVWGPFAIWMGIEHPDDIPLMYEDRGQESWRLTEDSVSRWEQRTREYIDVQLRGG